MHTQAFPFFTKPAEGKTTRHLRKTTKHLEKITKHLGETTRHFVFPNNDLAVRQVAERVTKKAIKPLLNFIYIKVLAPKTDFGSPADGRHKQQARTARALRPRSLGSVHEQRAAEAPRAKPVRQKIALSLCCKQLKS